MKRLLAPSLALALLLSGMLGAHAAAAGGDKPEAPATGRYIVLYEPAVRAARVDEQTAQLERRLGFDSRFLYRRAVRGFAARLSGADAAALRQDPQVRLVSPDRPLQASATVPLAPGGTVPTGAMRIGAASSALAHGASSVGVAVLDTGIDLSHPDLNAVNGTNCVGGGPANDDEGHGTHVSGTIAARNNGTGVVGVAPDTRLYAVKVLNSQGEGTDATLICGIDWVTANAAALKIRVANVSLGGLAPPSDCSNDPLHAAICASTAAGVSYTVAAGNSGWDIGDMPPDVPASFPEVLTVTAMADGDGLPGGLGPACSGRPDDVYANFSNFATRSGDIAHMVAAPGNCILSTLPGGGYGLSSGTSMAAPHAAGAIALCLGENGAAGPCAGMSAAQIIERIRADAAAHATTANGFLGDPLEPVGRYYGFMSWVGLPPVAVTGPASGISATRAKLAGTVNPNQAETSFRFQYGRTTAYGSQTAPAGAGAGATARAVGATISGLLPATTYHVRLIAGNSSGTTTGSDASFTTAPPPRGFYRGYTACARVAGAPPSHACERGEKVGAFFRAGADVIYTLCLSRPGGGTGCRRDLAARAGLVRVNRIGAGAIGAYTASWSVNGRVVARWSFRRTQ